MLLSFPRQECSEWGTFLKHLKTSSCFIGDLRQPSLFLSVSSLFCRVGTQISSTMSLRKRQFLKLIRSSEYVLCREFPIIGYIAYTGPCWRMWTLEIELQKIRNELSRASLFRDGLRRNVSPGILNILDVNSQTPKFSLNFISLV